MDLLNVEHLNAEYQTSNGVVRAVQDVSFSLGAGESLGIAGESACGKSTLGLSLIRMLQGGRVSGSVRFNGVEILGMDEQTFDLKYRWKDISMIFQGAMSSLDPVFIIRDQFTEILRRHDYTGDYDRCMMEATSSVGLDHTILEKFPHELSGGMKQRVVIALALLLKPRLVIADEPTTALDVLIQAQIINLLKDLKGSGTSFLLITHDLAILSEIADKIGIMYGGQMVEFGTSREVYGNPRHPYTQGLLGSIPRLHGGKPGHIGGVPPDLIKIGSACRFLPRCPHAISKCESDPPDFQTKSGFVRCWLYE